MGIGNVETLCLLDVTQEIKYKKSNNCFKATKNSLIWKRQETPNVTLINIETCIYGLNRLPVEQRVCEECQVGSIIYSNM